MPKKVPLIDKAKAWFVVGLFILINGCAYTSGDITITSWSNIGYFLNIRTM